MKKIVILNLRFAVKVLLRRLKPEVIAITGSAGKTTTKEILKKVLAMDFEVLASPNGYNTEIGAPLAIFGEKAPTNTKSILSWAKIVAKCYFKAFFTTNYPEKIIMEFGADAPGDIKYLASLFRPEKGVVLTVLPVHLERLKNIENIAKEKGELSLGVKKGGTVFLSADNRYTTEMKARDNVNKVTFGKSKDADFRAEKITSDISGLSFKVFEGSKETDIKVRLYGMQMIYPVLAAIAVARNEHMSYRRIKMALRGVAPYKGRMNIIEGIKESVIIDDTYNSNPESVLSALEFLGKQKGRKIALLGNMNELGEFTKTGHETIGKKAAAVADLLVTVGDLTKKFTVPAAKEGGLKEKNIKSFLAPEEAGEYLKKIIKKEDIVLAKGSQNNVRLEKALEIIIKDKDKKSEILVRQDDMWKNK